MRERTRDIYTGKMSLKLVDEIQKFMLKIFHSVSHCSELFLSFSDTFYETNISFIYLITIIFLLYFIIRIIKKFKYT